LPLLMFGARQTNKGVTYQIMRAGGRSFIRSAFKARMPNPKNPERRHEGIFKRAVKEGTRSGLVPRLTIHERKALSMAHYLKATNEDKRIEINVDERLLKNLDDQVRVVLEKGI